MVEFVRPFVSTLHIGTSTPVTSCCGSGGGGRSGRERVKRSQDRRPRGQVGFIVIHQGGREGKGGKGGRKQV